MQVKGGEIRFNERETRLTENTERTGYVASLDNTVQKDSSPSEDPHNGILGGNILC